MIAPVLVPKITSNRSDNGQTDHSLVLPENAKAVETLRAATIEAEDAA
jgi:hypothetical protein